MRAHLESEVIKAAKELYTIMDSLVQKPGVVKKSWEKPLPLASNGLEAMDRLGEALADLENYLTVY